MADTQHFVDLISMEKYNVLEKQLIITLPAKSSVVLLKKNSDSNKGEVK